MSDNLTPQLLSSSAVPTPSEGSTLQAVAGKNANTNGSVAAPPSPPLPSEVDITTNKDGGDRDPRKRQRAVVNNHNRAAVFRKWLIETFPSESLRLILDVAGGKGEVSVPLALAGYECVVVDPRECDWSKNRIVKNLQFHMAEKNTKTYNALADRIGRDRLEKDGLPMPGRLLEYFTAASPDVAMDATPPTPSHTPSSVEVKAKGSGVDLLSTAAEASLVGNGVGLVKATPPYTMHYVKTHCTILVGMHSDEATEPIVDFAIAHKRPFAVIPCCVFPKDNPHRKHPVTGKKVESYESFVAYLKAKPTLCGTPIVEEVLPFEGRNTVLYYTPKSNSANVNTTASV